MRRLTARRAISTLLPLLMALGAGCSCNEPPSIRARYAPFHPKAATSVTFQATAEDREGIERVDLYVYEYEAVAVAGQIVAQRRSIGAWGPQYSWNYPSDTKQTTVSHTMTAGFPDGSIVGFLFQVLDAEGERASEQWRFAAGQWPWPDEPIPLLTSGPPRDRVDIGFVAETYDYVTADQMLLDLPGLVYDGLFQANAIGPWRHLWNFHYVTETRAWSDTMVTGPWTPPQAMSARQIVNHAVLLHTRPRGDYAYLGDFTSETQNYGTMIHESGHAVFGLADEYRSSQGQRVSIDPYHNNYDLQADCERYNRENSWTESDCRRIAAGYDWWKPEPANPGCIMGRFTGPQVQHFGRSCLKRAGWYYDRIQTP